MFAPVRPRPESILVGTRLGKGGGRGGGGEKFSEAMSSMGMYEKDYITVLLSLWVPRVILSASDFKGSSLLKT